MSPEDTAGYILHSVPKLNLLWSLINLPTGNEG